MTTDVNSKNIKCLTNNYSQLMVSGGGGCPGPAVLRAVEEDLSLATDSVTLLPLVEVEVIARGNPRSPGSATPDHAKVSIVVWKIIRTISEKSL